MEVTGKARICPFCGLHLIFVDATCTIYHEAPVCERFKIEIAGFKLTEKPQKWTARIEPAPRPFIGDRCPMCGKLRLFVPLALADGHSRAKGTIGGEPVCSWEEQAEPANSFVPACRREAN